VAPKQPEIQTPPTPVPTNVPSNVSANVSASGGGNAPQKELQQAEASVPVELATSKQQAAPTTNNSTQSQAVEESAVKKDDPLAEHVLQGEVPIDGMTAFAKPIPHKVLYKYTPSMSLLLLPCYSHFSILRVLNPLLISRCGR
jgi:hypothetical protein